MSGNADAESAGKPPASGFQPSTPPKIRVLIVDDHAMVCQGLRTFVDLQDDMEVVAEASNGREAIVQAAALEPDVVLMDLEMPELDGYAATRMIKNHRPGTRVVALTVHGDARAREKAQEAGVDEFVEKGSSMDVLIRAIGGN